MSNNYLKYTILAGLFAIPFVPLIISSTLFFPFITGKAFAFRLIVEIIFACYLVLAIRDESFRPKFSWILGALVAFLVVMGVADFFAVNPFKAFWSNYERMEGYVTLLHLGAYFLVMGSVLKTQSLWNKLLATSLGASAIMAVYSFMQLAGKITINQGGVRVDGTLGNASYLGIYMVFHIFIAALLFVRFRANWQRGLIGIVAILDLVVLYFTATRGAILSLIGGAFITFLFLTLKSERGDKIRKIALAGVLGLLIFVGLFIAFKNTSFVQKSPVLSRFASLSLSEIETQGRYYVWPMAWKGFIEKPILGWGQEGFNFVFNKYYDPRMFNQEPWFDRAHSTPLDWLVAGGALGLLSYASIFFALLFYIFKSKNENLSKDEKAVMLGLISAYVFNNIFVFDQISSYILFFTIIAYMHSHAPETSLPVWDKVWAKFVKMFESEKARPIAEALILVFTIFIIYFVIYAPWQQNKDLLGVLKLNNEGKVETIGQYAKPFSGSSLGFSESLEHVSQTAINLAANPNATAEFKQQLFDVVDKAFVKQLARVPDDEVLGVGGTILKHVAENDEVSALILGDGELSRDVATLTDIKKREKRAQQVGKKLGFKNLFLEKFPDNQFDSVSLLSVTKIVEKYIDKVKPDIIYTHHSGDLNIDHKLTFQAVLTACRPQPGFFVKKILTFETPSSTEWEKKSAKNMFIPNFYNNITEFINEKNEALKIYKDEIRAFPHPRSYEGVKILAKFRGMTAGYKYAEAFEIIRELND